MALGLEILLFLCSAMIELPTSPAPRQLQALRKEHRLTQTQLGKLVFVNRRTVQHWEYGRSQMPVGLWELLCVRLGVAAPHSVQDLIGETVSEQEEDE